MCGNFRQSVIIYTLKVHYFYKIKPILLILEPITDNKKVDFLEVNKPNLIG